MRGQKLSAIAVGFCVAGLGTAPASDKEHLAMLADAQVAFDRVETAAAPPLTEASACVQMQAAVLSVALPAEEAELHYQKGFCQLAVAAVTRDPAAFLDAAAELDRGGAAMLAWIARRAGNSSNQAAWKEPDSCPRSCAPFVPVAKLWQGWSALNAGDTYTAAVRFDTQPAAGWSAYAAGLIAFRSGRYAEAERRYREALEVWTQRQRDTNPPLTWRLSPPVNIPQLLTNLGGTQILAGDPKGAVVTLDRALENTPKGYAYYLRARAKELNGQFDGALADYNLASRAAFADATDLATGEAHLYRGILYYRRKDFTHAEAEFASALNFKIEAGLRQDAAAWRHLSAVASGSCGASRQFLEQALATVSPYFPKAEAEAAASSCAPRVQP